MFFPKLLDKAGERISVRSKHQERIRRGYLVLPNYYMSLACTLLTAVMIIALFNFYISVAKDLPFKKRFAEMAGLSLGVAGLSFLVGLALRLFLGVEV